MTNKQRATLKKIIKHDAHFLIEYYNTGPKNTKGRTFSQNLDYFLAYVQEEVKEYLKKHEDFEGLVYTLDAEYVDVEHVRLGNLIINLEVLFYEYKEFLKNS